MTNEESAADEPTANVASCDIYRFTGGKLIELTSYNIEVADGAGI